MDKPSVALVIPTIRENCFRDFVDRWGRVGLFGRAHLIVVEDNPQRTFDAEDAVEKHSHFATTHFCWEDIDREMGDDAWIIPRRSDTVRSFGYLKAYELGYDFIMTLDDDCYPDPECCPDGTSLVEGHLKWLTQRTRWFNTLNSVKPRGVPFYNLGTNDRVVLNHGLWTNVLDYDAPYQLANPIPEHFSYDNRIVPSGLYFPMCGMNLMWRRDATVLMYHLLMGQMMDFEAHPHGMLRRLPFDRWGDIGCGIIMKKICDIQGLLVSSGTPYIRHERASNPFTNLKKEAAVLEVNERLWEYVDQAPLFPWMSLIESYETMGRHITTWQEFSEYEEYFSLLGRAMCVWASHFNKMNVVGNMTREST